MKTTLELPDDLLREVKIRAAQQNRRMKDVIADALRSALAAPAAAPSVPLSPMEALRQRLVFHADGSISNPGGMDDPSFFETLEALRDDSRSEPMRDPFRSA